MKLYFENNQGQLELPPTFRLNKIGAYRRRTKYQPRYSQDGDYNVSDGRVESRNLSFRYMHASGDYEDIIAAGYDYNSNVDQTKDEAYKVFISQLLGFFRPEYAPFYLVDTDAKLGAGVRAKIAFDDYEDDYEKGAIYRVSSPSMTVRMLSGHWEDYDLQVYENTAGLTTGDEFSITNDSDLEAYPIFTFYALDSVVTVTITNGTNGQFFTYSNTGFGAGSTLVVDGSGEEGKVELDGTETGFMLDEGSGFIVLEPGTNNFTYESTGTCQLTVEYRRRYPV